jgi:hypothetical protein
MADRSGFQPFFEATAFQAVVVHMNISEIDAFCRSFAGPLRGGSRARASMVCHRCWRCIVNDVEAARSRNCDASGMGSTDGHDELV